MNENKVINQFINAGNISLSNYLLDHYAEIGMTNDQLLIYIQIKKVMDQGENLPDLAIIAKNMHLTKNSVANLLQAMVAQGFAEIKNVLNNNGQRAEILNFDGLYNQLLEITPNKKQVSNINAVNTSRQEVFTSVESEFRRPLSNIELQTIGKWLDEEKYDPELILMALKEAVLNGVYNFRYIEQILVSWKQKNVQTELDVKQQRIKRQQKMQPGGNESVHLRNIPYIDVMNLAED